RPRRGACESAPQTVAAVAHRASHPSAEFRSSDPYCATPRRPEACWLVEEKKKTSTLWQRLDMNESIVHRKRAIVLVQHLSAVADRHGSPARALCDRNVAKCGLRASPLRGV
ncbi:MAG: hypothetical protein Q8O67_33260, partial [Deltaproteobacteria bacterium]|nr:hypothetical protein [Deltaproteobacteria bacterium]